MSKVVARCFQKCGICNREFQLEYEKAECEPTPPLVHVHLCPICPTCLQEMSEYLRNKYILNDVEYIGIQIGKMPTMEETNNE